MKHYRIYDYRQTSPIKNLITVVGVKYTTARDVSEQAISLVYEHLGRDVNTHKSAPVLLRILEFWMAKVGTNSRHLYNRKKSPVRLRKGFIFGERVGSRGVSGAPLVNQHVSYPPPLRNRAEKLP